MESYKHSCPRCGQHIEYTVEYCGQQMQCPECGQTVIFPAIPPRRDDSSARARIHQSKPPRTQSRPVPAAFSFLRAFQHWNVVVQCAVPFLIIGALLAGAAFVKNKLGDAAAQVSIPTVQANPDAWQRVTDLTKADQVVRARVAELNAAHTFLAAAEKESRLIGTSNPSQTKHAAEQMKRGETAVNVARRQFDDAYADYQRLGGTVDYRGQLPSY